MKNYTEVTATSARMHKYLIDKLNVVFNYLLTIEVSRRKHNVFRIFTQNDATWKLKTSTNRQKISTRLLINWACHDFISLYPKMSILLPKCSYSVIKSELEWTTVRTIFTIVYVIFQIVNYHFIIIQEENVEKHRKCFHEIFISTKRLVMRNEHFFVLDGTANSLITIGCGSRILTFP